MQTESKFKQGDIVYSINVSKYLIINVTKLVVDYFFFNDRPEHNKYIYHCIGLDHDVIRDNEIQKIDKDSKVRVYGKTISGSFSEESLCKKSELEEKIKLELNERIKQNERKKNAEEQFRCPITGGKLIKEPYCRHILDGPTTYKVEGFSIIWEVYPRDWERNIYHARHKGVDYNFSYLGEGIWKEVLLIEGENGGGIYVDKKLYISGEVEVLKIVEEFLSKQKEERKKYEEYREKTKNEPLLPLAKKVEFKTIYSELISVVPMSQPSAVLFYMEEPKHYIIIVIEGEGEYEIEADAIKKWNYKELESGMFEFGSLIFSIKK
jgi:hypothetical protein